MQQKAEQAPQGRKDAEGKKPHAAWPLDVMVAAATAVVDRGLVPKRVSEELGIPYTTLIEWVKKYRAGGRAALQARPARSARAGEGPREG